MKDDRVDKFTVAVFLIGAYGFGNILAEADWTIDENVNHEWIFECIERDGWFSYPFCSRMERRFRTGYYYNIKHPLEEPSR